MHIILTNHVRERMAERGISRADIERSIDDAHTTFKSGVSVTYIGPGMNGNDLKVWIVLKTGGSSDRRIVKSAAWKDQEDPA